MQMINETVLLKHIQKPYEFGVKARKMLRAKFRDMKYQAETFLDDSDSSVDACQKIGEQIGRFVGRGVGFACSYVIVPSIAAFILLTLRVSKRIQVRWLNMRAWVNEPALLDEIEESTSAAVAHNNADLNLETAPVSAEDEQAGMMVALPPSDQSSPPLSLGQSIAFVQATAVELPKSFTAKGIKQAYQKAKRRSQHNPMLTGLVTAGFTALSFFAIQLNPAKEAAIASHAPESQIEEVARAKTNEGLTLDPKNLDLDPDGLDFDRHDMN